MSSTLSTPVQRPAASGRSGVLSAFDGRAVAPWSVLGGLLVLRTVLMTALVAGIRLADPQAWPTSLFAANALIVLVDIATLAVVVAVLRRQGVRLRELIGWRGGRDVGASVVWSLVILVAFVVFSFAANLLVYRGAPPTGTAHIALWIGIGALIAPFTIGLAEEVLYRGVLQDQITRRTGRVAGVLIVAVFFSLQHAPLVWLSAEAVAAKLITTFLAGLLFGVLALRLRRLGPLVVAHIAVDLLGLGLPTLAMALMS